MTDDVRNSQPATEPISWWAVGAADGLPPAGSAKVPPTTGLAADYPPASHRPGRNSPLQTAGAGLAIVGLLAGGVLGARLHDAVAGNGTSSTGTLAAPASPGVLPGSPTLPTSPGQTIPGQTIPGQTIPGQSGAGQAPTATASGNIATKVMPSVVDIYTTLPDGSGAGTGMILTASGDVLTNNHVIDGATSIRVVLVTTGRSYTAKVVGTDPTEDVAVVHLTGATGLQPISTANSSAVAVGDAVVALGNAGGRGGAPSVVSGSVVATNRSITVGDQSGGASEHLSGLIQTNAAIEPGDSGGPLVDTDARVIGMDTAASVSGRFDGTASEGYATPINTALAIAHQIESGRASSSVHIGVRGLLGVSVAELSSGAQVAGVTAGSPADAAGLTAGDTITAIDGHSVASATALTTLIRSHRPGDTVRVAWVDGSGSAHSATVTLAVGPPD